MTTEHPDTSTGSTTPSPETGDIVIDAALADLAGAHREDLDGQIEAGQHVHRTLQARLADLGDD